MSQVLLESLLEKLPPGASLYHGTRGWIVRYPRYKWFGADRSRGAYKGVYRGTHVDALRDFRRWILSR